MSLFLSVLEQGLIYAILALGVYITFKILDFPDMSVDSSFPLGAAVTALMIQAGCSPLLTLPVSMIAGALAGALTGVIHVRFKVRDLLSGIIVMTGLYCFLSIRFEGTSILDFIRYAVAFFITGQQLYEWRI